MDAGHGSTLSNRVRDFVLEDFSPRLGQVRPTFASHPLWQRLSECGSELWLDSGDVDEVGECWTREFTALTTNNTLLNQQVQKGIYDDLIVQASRLLEEFPLSGQQRKLELAFILNARHALRLVETFDAYVSVEEHTDLSDDLPAALAYARRYHEICPQRFYVKIPLSAAGVLATRRCANEGIAVNHTLGFSARQNYLVARLGRPAFVNVFLGRLNSFVAQNKLGEGTYVGEKATLASQAQLRGLREELGITTRQIGASFRDGRQVRDLAGLDVMTIPPKVAKDFLALGLKGADLQDCTARQYDPALARGVDERTAALHTLWDVDDRLVECLHALDKENLDTFTPGDLVAFLGRHGCGDVLPEWTRAQRQTSADEGKIPNLEHWRDLLEDGVVGLDSLMNLAGWNSFNADQVAMDARVQDVLQHSPA
ncbi:MAG: transaldolase family protein [Planctomycetaceae bacterium]|nr:transaldolase family protein [Planctomycetaceae bacterium]